MSNSSIYSALSGLSAAQLALDTVSNNVANVNVQDYSRQSTVMTQANSTYNGVGWIGNGVQVTSVRREYNDFITNQLRQAQATNSEIATRFQQMQRIDDMLAGKNSISGALQDFFSSLQILVSNADDPAARQTLLGKAESLVNQFKVTDDYLRNQNKDINTQLASSVEQINVYAKQIANLNHRISTLRGIGGSDAPNDLLDQRDKLVNELNRFSGVEVVAQDGKSFNITIGKGYTLVQGNQVGQLATIPSDIDPTRLVVAYVDDAAGNVPIPETELTSGSLGGLLAFRSQDLSLVHNEVNQLALVFADKFNQQHKAGVDLHDADGVDFFNVGAAKILTYPGAKSSLSVTDINDVSKIQATDYQVSFDGADWKVKRVVDGAPVTVVPAGSPVVDRLEFDGLVIEISGTSTKGDAFVVQPVVNAIAGMSLVIHDPVNVALGQKDGGVGDNRNGQLLLKLQSEKTVQGSKSFNDSWAGTISDVGNKTKTHKVTGETQENVVKQLVKQQQAVSGVNLDEEYGKLQHFQQYYMANAKVLQTASGLFDALLAAIR